MRKALFVAGLAFLFPLSASANSNLGVQLGLAFPGGDKWDGYAMTNDIGLAIPIELSLNVAVAQQTTVGLYGSYAPVALDADFADYCDAWSGTCDEHLWRVGVKAEHAFSGQGISPFIGARVGFEWDLLNESVPNDGTDYTQTLRGWELGFEVGVDAWMSEASKVGAFVGYSFGEYNRIERDGYIDLFDVTGSGSLANSANHSWLTVGVRGSFGM